DALLRLALTAQGEEGFALKVEQVLLADHGTGRNFAAAEDVGHPAGYLHVVFGGNPGLTHEKDACVEDGEGGGARRGNRAWLWCGISAFGQRNSLRLGIEEKVFAIECDAIGGQEEPKSACLRRRGRHLR